MSTEPFIGQIKVFAFDFAPKSHALCNGQTLLISQNQALFSLLGTTYGGDGVTTFKLPNLQGRAALHFGQGPGLSNYTLGQTGGEEGHILSTGEIPQHNHIASASNNTADQTYPTNNLWANAGSSPGYSATGGSLMNAQALSNAGSSQPHQNMSPFLVVNFSIALSGIFPSRN